MQRNRCKLKSLWTEVLGWRLHARVNTTAADEERLPIVLIHGLLISSRYMIPTAERLGVHYPVYALDLPGFGRSEGPAYVLNIAALADSVVAWMDAVKLERVILLGNSLGCQVLISLAVRYPERVAQLILTGSTVDPQARTVIQQASRLLVDFVLEPPSLLYHLAIDAAAAGVWRTWRTFQSALRAHSEEQLYAIQAPTLLVRGSRDLIATQSWLEEMARRLPNSRLQVIPGGPHCINYSTPDELVTLVERFLQQPSQPHPLGEPIARQDDNRQDARARVRY